jgi:hypothetical protein
MLVKLSKAIGRHVSPFYVLVTIALSVFVNVVFFPHVWNATALLDLQFFNTPEKAYSWVEAYGAEGRIQYRNIELTADIAWPMLYTLLLSWSITWLFKRSVAEGNKAQMLNVVPFGALLFDLLENACIVTMLSIFPSKPTVLAWMATACTTVKWLFVGASILVLLVGVVAMIRTAIVKKEKATASGRAAL